MRKFLTWLHAWLSTYIDNQNQRILKVYDQKHRALETFTYVRDELTGVVDSLGDERIEYMHQIALKRQELGLAEGAVESLTGEIESVKATIKRIDGLLG